MPPFQDSWRSAPRRALLGPKTWIPLRPEGWKSAADGLILSPSGWRKVFAPQEKSTSAQVNPADLQLVASAAWLYAVETLESHRFPNRQIAVAHDSRPTSPALMEAAMVGLLAAGARVQYLGLLPIPHLAAHVQSQPELEGFCYVSASHNPPGHNGLKFGNAEGKVLPPRQAAELIRVFQQLLQDPKRQEEILLALAAVEASTIEQAYRQASTTRRPSFDNYARLFSLIAFGRTEPEKNAFRQAVGVVADLNGGARSVSLDKEMLQLLGLKTVFLNTRPGEFAHDILPEGEALQPCARELANHPDFTLGYVTDCDGDRGNLVVMNRLTREVRLLEAQEVFALCVLSELTRLVDRGLLTYDEDGYPEQRVAIVANDPTSLRIDRIAAAFRVPVFRAEVGEANLVALADQLRGEGWYVGLLGEGSNGGNITWPGTVRDPLSTLASVLHLVSNPRLFQIWLERRGLMPEASVQPTLDQILKSLPAFITTPVGSPRAILKIPALPPARFKALFETLFVTQGWNSHKDFLAKNLDIWGWEEINYEGPEEKRGFGPPFRTGRETGGLKILLKDHRGQPKGFLWMRQSGTEPVLRVLVDIESTNPFHEEYLLNWFVGMLKKIS